MEIKISKINILLILSIACFLCSCSDIKKSDYIGKSYPMSQKVTNRFFDAELTPIFLSWNDFFFPEITTSYAYDIGVVFRLDIKNNCNSNIEIDWNKTQYLHKGQLLGGLLFPGMDYLNRDKYLPPDIIPAHFATTKVVIPNKLLYFDKTWVYSYETG